MLSKSRLSHSITAQITALVILAVALGHLLTAGVGMIFFDDTKYSEWSFGPATVSTVLTVFFIALVTLYSARWITSPLSAIVAATTSFGKSGTDDTPLDERGPREIALVARALNDTRSRVRSLVDGRTRMLVAISHDLRTPLTRLRLRAERVEDVPSRDGMIRDIEAINDMLTETLTYVREGGWQEPVQQCDLPSLLQTICSEFSDVGHTVSYTGPHRIAFACRPRALSRAVTNIVENATKHGGTVAVTLEGLPNGAAQIDVSDDGPGIPPALKEKVFEPFFKADDARTSRGGFGLGLAIARDIVRDHGGDVELRDAAPKGLLVRMTLPTRNIS